MKKTLFLLGCLLSSIASMAQVNNAAMIFDPDEGGSANTALFQYLPVPIIPEYNGSFTVESWVKIPDPAASSANLFSSGTATQPALGGFTLAINSANVVVFRLRYSGGNLTFTSSGVVPFDDTWHHIAVTVDEANDELKMYIDGVLDMTDVLPPAYTNNNQNSEMVIGQNTQKEVHMDEIRMWSAVRSETEINEFTQNCPSATEANLEMRFTGENYVFNPSSGSILLQDMSPNGNSNYLNYPNGDIFVQGAVCCGYVPDLERENYALIVPHANETYQWYDCATNQAIPGANGQTYTPTSSGDYYCEFTLGNCVVTSGCANVDLSQPSPYVGAQDFNAANQKITITDTDLPVAGTISQFTIESWIRPAKPNWGRIASKFAGTGLPVGTIVLDTYNPSGDNGRNLRLGINGGSGLETAVAANVLTPNTWQHVAVTFDNGNVKFYVNGVLAGSGTMPSSSIPGTAQNWVIGGDDDITATPAWFGGYISDFRLWSDARTAAEISTFMDSCLVGDEANLEVLYDFNEITGTSVPDKSQAGNDAVLSGTSTITVIDGKVMCVANTGGNVGLEESVLDNVSIAPNPNNGTFTINNLPAGAQIRIIDAVGRQILSQQTQKQHIQCSLPESANGIYFVQILTQNSQKSIKILVD